MRCCVKAEHPPPALFTSCPHCTKCDLVVEKMDKRIRIGAVAVLWHFFLLLLFLLKGTWQHTGFWGFLLTELKESWFLLLLSQTQDSIGIHPAGSTDWIDFLRPEAWDRRDLVSTCLSFLFSSCQPPVSSLQPPGEHDISPYIKIADMGWMTASVTNSIFTIFVPSSSTQIIL